MAEIVEEGNELAELLRVISFHLSDPVFWFETYSDLIY